MTTNPKTRMTLKNKRYYTKHNTKVRSHIFYRDIQLRKTRRPQKRTVLEFGLTSEKVDQLFEKAVEKGEDAAQIGSYYRNLKNYVEMIRARGPEPSENDSIKKLS